MKSMDWRRVHFATIGSRGWGVAPTRDPSTREDGVKYFKEIMTGLKKVREVSITTGGFDHADEFVVPGLRLLLGQSFPIPSETGWPGAHSKCWSVRIGDSPSESYSEGFSDQGSPSTFFFAPSESANIFDPGEVRIVPGRLLLPTSSTFTMPCQPQSREPLRQRSLISERFRSLCTED